MPGADNHGFASLGARPATRHGRVAQALLEEIARGRYPVGSRLPTEADLERRFGVSRATVRQAIRHLRELGLVTARAGVGTTVMAREATPKAVLSMNSVHELLQFTRHTRLKLLAKSEVAAGEALAATLRCRAGEAWLQLDLLRTIPRMREPLGVVQVWIRPEFSSIAHEVDQVRTTVFSILERRFGVELRELQQEISPAGMPAAAARRLRVKAGSPALRILRHYYDRHGEIPQVSLGYYPEGRFTYSTRMRMSLGAPPG
jgi:DNA-binding GntR family transcriptional regulator